jgi:CheY-like chemotaxis protein
MPDPPHDSCRLLIADDSPEMRWLVRASVGDRFATVIETVDGRQLMWTLLRLFTQAPAEVSDLVVITDLCMPAYDGLAVLEAWRELACDVPMILLTAFPSATVRARAEDLGAFVLAKPFQAATLRLLVGGILDGRRVH